MPTILDRIVEKKIQEIAIAKSLTPISELEIMPNFKRTCSSFKAFLKDPHKNGIIAEFKRRSPSKGVINGYSDVVSVVQGYEMGGASAISVLTDESYFGGHARDLITARETTKIPLLRKDFMIDEYQLLEAKAWGADVILLIASILSPQQVRDLANIAQSLGLQVLLEVHTEAELDASLGPNIDAVGINNRNLADFSVNLETSYHLVKGIPNSYLKISESGLSDAQTVHDLKSAGFDGFLMGENFMRTDKPGRALSEFSAALSAT